MGTRADFYVGRGKSAEWIGSIAYDGYPEGVPEDVVKTSTESEFRSEVAKLTGGEDGTLPSMGWPWPWENSNTTDYAYAFEGGQVYGTCFGRGWWPADKPEPDSGVGKLSDWPEIPKNTAPLGSTRSGILVFSVPGKPKPA